MRHALVISIALLIAAASGPACDSPPVARDGRLRVAVSIQPQTYFVRRIGGDFVNVHAVLGPGQSHGAYDPTAKQIAALTDARAFFRIGVAFETPVVQRLREVAPSVEIIDTRAGIELLHTAEHAHADEPVGDSGSVHAPADAHACGDSQLDPHIWLDPVLVKTQARTICDSLARLDSAHADDYRRNLAVFDAECDALDARLRALLAPHRGEVVLVFHPSFAYLCRRYGLEQVVIETEGKEPSARRLGSLIQTARAQGISVVFSQVEYSAAGARAVAQAIGAKVVRLAPQSPDWAKNLVDMCEAIARSFAQSDADAPRQATHGEN